jgi:hypothetical protein
VLHNITQGGGAVALGGGFGRQLKIAAARWVAAEAEEHGTMVSASA